MPNLYVTEYAEVGLGLGGRVAKKMPCEMPLVDGVVPFDAVGFYGPLNPATQVVRLETDTTCSVLFSAARTAATANNQRMYQNAAIKRAVHRGSGLYISVIENSGAAPKPSKDAQPLGMP